MLEISLIMLGAGDSTRLGLQTKKQWLRIGDDPLWLFASKNLASFYKFKEIIIVSDEPKYMQKFEPDFIYVKGGKNRQESLKNALNIASTEFVLVSDIARPCISKELFFRIIDKANEADCIIPYLSVSDTAYLEQNAVDRTQIKLIQTPQLSKVKILKQALQTDTLFTDESSAIKAINGKIAYVKGDENARKITTSNDLSKIIGLKPPTYACFVGGGFDVHKFTKDKELILCGVKVPYELGLEAHSDGDVATHALCDALLGAAGLGDIGEHFPDTDEKFKNANSIELLKKVYTKIKSMGFEIVNADITIMAERPKLSQFKDQMQIVLAQALNTKVAFINVKATTTEKLGFVGRGEGIAASANASLRYYNWQSEAEREI